MRRRTYLAGSIGVVGGLAGCAGVLGDSDGSESNDDRSPAETVEAFYEAALDGDGETVRSHMHPESEVRPPTDGEVERIQSSSLQVEETTVVEEGEDEATVEATISQEMWNGERQEHSKEFLLRRDDGEWKIYDQPLAGSDGPAAPSVQWDAFEQTNDAGTVTAVIFEHSGGDNVDPSTLSATVGDSTVGAPEATSDVTVGTGVVVPFDGGGESLGAGANVELVWTDPDGGSSQVLAMFTLGDDTAGSPAGQLRIE